MAIIIADKTRNPSAIALYQSSEIILVINGRSFSMVG
jgi:hypothetical protein